MNKDTQILLADLGYGVARISAREGAIGQPYTSPRLTIMIPSTTEEQTHAPAESIEIYGLAPLTALRDLLNQAIAIAHKGTSADPVIEAMKQIQPTTP
jgi:hypothetical protein